MMDSNLQRERERSIKAAELSFIETINTLNLKYELERFGNKPIETIQCNLLLSDSSKKISQGYGKGINKRSELSAKYEALEYCTGLVSNTNRNYTWLSFKEALTKKIPIIKSCIPEEFLEKNNPQAHIKIPWVTYTNYTTNDTALVPAFCTHPHYIYHPDENDTFGYSQFYLPLLTHGLAASCTKTEALTHAILELMETDALSLFMIKTFLKKDPEKPTIIREESLPDSIRKLIIQIKEETKMEMAIFPLNETHPISTYGCILYNRKTDYPIRGWGASLNPEYAIERAVLESLQSFHADRECTELKWATQKLKEWRDLQRCVKFNLVPMIQSGFITQKSFEETISAKYRYQTLDDYLNQLVEIISEDNFTIFINTTWSTKDLHTLHVIIPEAEDFFSIEKGLIKLPKERGLALLRNTAQEK